MSGDLSADARAMACPGPLVAVATDHLNLAAGRDLARRLALTFLDPGVAAPQMTPFILSLSGDGLALLSSEDRFGAIVCDFTGGRMRHRHHHGGGVGQAIARAVGLKHTSQLLIADLTAGLGEDAFVLAGLGARVVMVERHPVVAALLEDGLRRARQVAQNADILAAVARLSLVTADAREWLVTTDPLDVIYLDPMFPERHKSALVRKEMQVLQRLVGADADCDELLGLALERARYRVVVKRARQAPPLAGLEPTFCVAGKTTRFDVYALRKLPGTSTQSDGA
jgi:16S rRNA (guanine1516-N2)-methyltransferase